ncbi:hypothetical protein MA9V1_198 [Chryseobacterium phage MA9V-1]|nr:hypothetical protein MA9V1_198 [Chryseobacterium phage MA9V-1]
MTKNIELLQKEAKSCPRLIKPFTTVHNALKQALFAGHKKFKLYKVEAFDIYKNNLADDDYEVMIDNLANNASTNCDNWDNYASYVTKQSVIRAISTRVIAFTKAEPHRLPYVTGVLGGKSVTLANVTAYVRKHIEEVDMSKVTLNVAEENKDTAYEKCNKILASGEYGLIALGTTTFAIVKRLKGGKFDVAYNVNVIFNPVAEIYAVMVQTPEQFKESSDEYLFAFTSEEPTALLTILNIYYVKPSIELKSHSCICGFKPERTTLETFYRITQGLLEHTLINFGNVEYGSLS